MTIYLQVQRIFRILNNVTSQSISLIARSLFLFFFFTNDFDKCNICLFSVSYFTKIASNIRHNLINVTVNVTVNSQRIFLILYVVVCSPSLHFLFSYDRNLTWQLTRKGILKNTIDNASLNSKNSLNSRNVINLLLHTPFSNVS